MSDKLFLLILFLGCDFYPPLSQRIAAIEKAQVNSTQAACAEIKSE